MEGVLIAYGVIAYIVNIIFCCWLANEKQRSVGAWILLGILFPGLSIIAVAGAPGESYRPSENHRPDYSEKPQAKKAYWEKEYCPYCDTEVDGLADHVIKQHPDKILNKDKS